jgi:hypothetical protein
LIFNLFLGEAVFKTDYAVERVSIFGILAEISNADKLELVAGACISEAGLDECALELRKGLGVEEIEIGHTFGDVCGVLDVEETVI